MSKNFSNFSNFHFRFDKNEEKNFQIEEAKNEVMEIVEYLRDPVSFSSPNFLFGFV